MSRRIEKRIGPEALDKFILYLLETGDKPATDIVDRSWRRNSDRKAVYDCLRQLDAEGKITLYTSKTKALWATLVTSSEAKEE